MDNNFTYIIGHKNPDTDAICAAIAYDAYKKAKGINNTMPARCGNANARMKTLLKRFDLPLPIFIGDITPKVQDIMIKESELHKLTLNSTCTEALELIDKYDFRSLPVVNDENSIQGVVSIFNLGEYFIPKPPKTKRPSKVHTNLKAIVNSLSAKTVNLVDEQAMEDFYLRVGVMDEKTFGDFEKKEAPPEQCIIVVGNRKVIQEKAIELGVRLLVITGTGEIEKSIVEKAKKNKVSVIKSPFDVATTAWVIRSAIYIPNVLQKDIALFHPDEKLSRVRHKIANNIAPIYFVSEKNNKLVGIFSKSDILKPIKTKIILVDHNELGQAVTGAGEVEITEIIDHHKLANPYTPFPICFINKPYGSTCTIIAEMFRKDGIDPSPSIAGAMMGGIITDTLNLKSPTTTPIDCELLAWLGKIAGMNPDKFAEMIFSSGSIIIALPFDEVIESDCKIYEEEGYRFSVSQVEELGFDNFWKRSEDLSNALENYRKKEHLKCAFLLVTDINTQNSLLIIRGDENFIDLVSYPQIQKKKAIFELEGIVSRKKQLIPYITSIITDNKTLMS